MSHLQNIARIKAVYSALEELGNEVVFVGGATVSLYTDRPSGGTRPTDDVDIVVELANYNGYADVEDKLRAKGFENDMESGVIGRYRVQGIVVDIMPTIDTVLGFANRWYPQGFEHAMEKDLGNDCTVQIFQPVHFIASKLEAFHDRGDGDGRMSQDFEDIVFVLNNRSSIWEELQQAPAELKSYLQEEFTTYLANDYFHEWISAHLDHAEAKRADFIIGGLEDFCMSAN